METIIKQYKSAAEFNIDNTFRFKPDLFQVSSVSTQSTTVGGSFPHGSGGSWSYETWAETTIVVVYTRTKEDTEKFNRKLERSGYRR
jgi:hypothetical protein